LPDRLEAAGAGSFIAVVDVAAGVVAPVVGAVGVLLPLQEARAVASVTPATNLTTLRLILFLDIIEILLRLYLLRLTRHLN
jgi:hypothetical protein